MKSPRATKINPACGQRPSGEVLFRSRPRSRRSSNEVAPSAGGGGGARDRRSRFSSSSPVRRGATGRTFSVDGLQPGVKLNNCDSKSRSGQPPPPRAGLGAARHPKIGACFAKHRWRWPARGLGQVRTISVGVSQGGGNPLGCDLCLLSVASQKVGAPRLERGRGKELILPARGSGARRGHGRS